jgi:hypothetical protein
MRAACAIIGFLLTATVGVAQSIDQGTVYLWVDENGTPHYQDRPPDRAPGAAQELNLRYRLTDPAVIAAAAKRNEELSAAAGIREEQEAERRSAEEAERERDKNARAEGCRVARERLQKYESAHRLYKPGPDGQRTYLTDEETDAARADARRTVAEWCGQ